MRAHGRGRAPGRVRVRVRVRDRRDRERRGFTLIEMVVTLLVLALMAAVAIPAFRPPRVSTDLDLATERIEALLRIARDSAIRSAVPVTVVVDSASSLVWLTTVASPDTDLPAGWEPGGITVPGGIGRGPNAGGGSSLDLPSGVRMELTSARARFRFQPTGAVFGDSLYLRDATGVRLVTVNPWSGHAIVQR